MQTATTQSLAILKFSRTREGKPVLSVTRRDGTVAWQKQHAFFPVHDLTHYAIETTLGLRQAFWGMMADGWEFGDFGTPWPRGPMPNLADAMLAEVSAGWFDQFGSSVENNDAGAAELNAHLATYSEQHGLAPPRIITAGEFGRILLLREELAARWHALGPREAMELAFDIPWIRHPASHSDQATPPTPTATASARLPRPTSARTARSRRPPHWLMRIPRSPFRKRRLREGFAPAGPRHRRARVRRGGIEMRPWRAGGSAPLATAVSLPTAREARPGAQWRDTPASGC